MSSEVVLGQADMAEAMALAIVAVVALVINLQRARSAPDEQMAATCEQR